MSQQPANPGEEATPERDADTVETDAAEVLGTDPEAETVKAEALGPETLIESLRVQLSEAEKRVVETRDQLLRKAAELENVKRRLTKQLNEQKKYAAEETAREMLPVLDDLELAFEHAKGSEGEATVETFLDGMSLVKRKFLVALERYGIVPFDSIGKPFDPKVHEAISQQNTDAYPDGHVAGEYLKGYMIHDRLLRPALVIVARNPDSPSPETPEA